VSGVAWHCYAGDVAAQGLVHDKYPQTDTYFTECSGGDWSPDFAENLIWTTRNLIIGGTRNWARGVLMWNLALDEKHGPHTGGCGNCRGVVTIDSRDGRVTRNEDYYAFAQASRFVRPGAHRVSSEGGPAGVDHVAFVNPDGSLVLVAVNANPRRASILVSQAGHAFAYILPATSVATFRWSPR
jgi:glucosylceramidase